MTGDDVVDKWIQWNESVSSIRETFAQKSLSYSSRGMREGQTLMNELALIARQIERIVVGSRYDPFHDDSRIEDFLRWVDHKFSVWEQVLRALDK